MDFIERNSAVIKLYNWIDDEINIVENTTG